jgi:succinate dehydrogenase / fumarate reductase cytochrome b subunit
MNSVAILWPAAYNQVCEFLGANWYALVASIGLAVLFIIHIIYACWLTLQNRKARGNDRYAVTSRPPQVEWSSKNMLVLGVVVVAFLVVHLIQFWSKMQLQELLHTSVDGLPVVGDAPAAPQFGTLFIQLAFQNIVTPIVYIIGFVALWFHMNHGFWSMFHTIGWDNNIWINRFKKIGCWWTSIVVALFIIQAVVFTIQARNDYYTTDSALQEQYGEFWQEKAQTISEDFINGINEQVADLVKDRESFMANQEKIREIQDAYIASEGAKFVEAAKAIENAVEKQCPNVAHSQEMQQMQQISAQIERQIEMSKNQEPRK